MSHTGLPRAQLSVIPRVKTKLVGLLVRWGMRMRYCRRIFPLFIAGICHGGSAVVSEMSSTASGGGGGLPALALSLSLSLSIPLRMRTTNLCGLFLHQNLVAHPFSYPFSR